MQSFYMSKAEYKRLERLYRRIQKDVGRSAGVTLNNLAFGLRDDIFSELEISMIIRDSKFMRSNVRVNKASIRAPIASQRSAVGSIERARFSGWLEQESGEKADRTRTLMLFARGNTRTKKAKPSMRMKPTLQPMRPEDIGAESAHIKGSHHRAQVLLVWTRRNKWRKPFILHGHNTIESGLYKWKGRKLRKVQAFADSKAQPKRLKWMTYARNSYMRGDRLGIEWRKAVTRVLTYK